MFWVFGCVGKVFIRKFAFKASIAEEVGLQLGLNWGSWLLIHVEKVLDAKGRRCFVEGLVI